MTIFAPSATKISAVRYPMPLVAPVITATLPSSFPICFPLRLIRRQPEAASLEPILPAGSSQGELCLSRASAYFRAGGHILGPLVGLNQAMNKLVDEFRRGWQGISQPSAAFCIGFCALCLLLSTFVRWGLAQIRPDVFFTPYFPAVFFVTAVCGLRYGFATALWGGVLGLAVNFSPATADAARVVLLGIFWLVAALTIWGVAHYRGMVAQQLEVSRRLIQEEGYRRLVVEELQHRAKNKLSTIHAVLHQVL